MVAFETGVVRSLVIAGLLCCVILGASSCAPMCLETRPPLEKWEPPSDEEVTALREQKRRLNEEITDLIGEAPCGASSDCGAMAFGVKPCGGAWKYLVYSAAYTDESLLKARIQEYNVLDARWNELTGAISDCMIVKTPPVGCYDGECVQGR